MIDWIKVRKERRMKLVVVNQQDIEDYILLAKLPDAKTISSFDFPEHWTVSGVSYDFKRQAFLFVILSPDFVPAMIGAEPEILPADRHIVEITRKAVSA